MVGPAGQFPVHALYGTDCHAVFRYDVRHFLVGQAEGLDAGVVAAVEPAVDERSDTEARAEGVAYEVVEALGASGRFEAGIYLGQDTAQGLPVCVQVAVVVDEHGYSECVLKERPESNAVAERRKVGQIAAYDTVGVIGRAGKGEADCRRAFFKFIDYGFEPCDHSV